jgi:hypothetical protein
MFADVSEERTSLVRMFRICGGSEDGGRTMIRNVDNIHQTKRRHTPEEKYRFQKNLKSNHQSENNTSQNSGISIYSVHVKHFQYGT